MCNHTKVYELEIEVDEEAMIDGWDGDEPLDPELEWKAYAATLALRCSECGDDFWDDSICGIWGSDDWSGNQDVLSQAFEHLLPEGVSRDDVTILSR